jgi:uracil-DNA glycosylase
MIKNIQIEESWKQALTGEFTQEYFQKLVGFVKSEYAGKVIYPPGRLIFNAFNQTPLQEVKVVILGQDPYINPGQAHGLSFSVPDGTPIPPSLNNIFEELVHDLGVKMPRSGNLTPWAKQGVFLLNAVLTVRAGESGSHSKQGWELFTDAAIKAVSGHNEHVVFMLWGNYAKMKIPLIDAQKHLILSAGHPSPLSVRFFSGCRHFSKANEWLVSKGKTPINWSL